MVLREGLRERFYEDSIRMLDDYPILSQVLCGCRYPPIVCKNWKHDPFYVAWILEIIEVYSVEDLEELKVQVEIFLMDDEYDHTLFLMNMIPWSYQDEQEAAFNLKENVKNAYNVVKGIDSVDFSIATSDYPSHIGI